MVQKLALELAIMSQLRIYARELGKKRTKLLRTGYVYFKHGIQTLQSVNQNKQVLVILQLLTNLMLMNFLTTKKKYANKFKKAN